MSTRPPYIRVIVPFITGLWCWNADAAPQARDSTPRGLSLQADCGVLSVVPIAEGALRVRCAPASTVASASLILIPQAKNVHFSIRRTTDSESLTTSRVTATFDRKTGALRFSNPR